MDTTATLDSFQLIIGLYLLYTAIRGKGTLYNFFDLSEEDQLRVKTPLRIIYGICAAICFAEVAVCMYMADSPSTPLISFICTILIFAILIGILIWLRKLASRK